MDETRAAGAKPILLAPLVRRSWDKGNPGKNRSTLAPYAEAVRKLATAKEVLLVDLHAPSQELCESLGPEKCLAFSPMTKVDGPNRVDNTHLNAQGSLKFAALVLAELCRIMPDIMPYFREAGQTAVRVESK